MGRRLHKQLLDVSNRRGLREQGPPGNERGVCQQGFLGALPSRGSPPLWKNRRANACTLESGFRLSRNFTRLKVCLPSTSKLSVWVLGPAQSFFSFCCESAPT